MWSVNLIVERTLSAFSDSQAECSALPSAPRPTGAHGPCSSPGESCPGSTLLRGRQDPAGPHTELYT